MKRHSTHFHSQSEEAGFKLLNLGLMSQFFYQRSYPPLTMKFKFQIVLQDSLHQPQYVEKLEKVIRFIIKEKSLSLQDLDDIWAAQGPML
jgi:hypothetical protein